MKNKTLCICHDIKLHMFLHVPTCKDMKEHVSVWDTRDRSLKKHMPGNQTPLETYAQDVSRRNDQYQTKILGIC